METQVDSVVRARLIVVFCYTMFATTGVLGELLVAMANLQELV